MQDLKSAINEEGDQFNSDDIQKLISYQGPKYKEAINNYFC